MRRNNSENGTAHHNRLKERHHLGALIVLQELVDAAIKQRILHIARIPCDGARRAAIFAGIRRVECGGGGRCCG